MSLGKVALPWTSFLLKFLVLKYKNPPFVLSSKFEGLPNVLIEAQKYNTPVISSNCPTGPNEILLNGKLGDLFPVENYLMLSKKLFNFYKNNKQLKTKSKRAKKYLIRFDPIINSKKYFELFFTKWKNIKFQL